MVYLTENYNNIQKRILATCQRCDRKPEEITLLGVTKTIDEKIVNASIGLGIANIGENKPQEIKRKYDLIDKDVKWHMIGHLQSNKVKMILDKVSLIHSLDRLSLLNEIEKRAKMTEQTVEALIQVNIGDEFQKSGIASDALETLIEAVSKCRYIRVKGLMCIAPYFDNPEDVRPFFKKMKNIFDTVRKIEYNNVKMQILSMGMSHDFEIAIEEGATLIRVGTGLYGARNY